MLSLTSSIVHVARECELDIVHAHYAVPHATAAYLARQILETSAGGGRVTRVVTTLHGTDITLVGSDRSYSETVAFSIEQSDGVTAVSESLRNDTYRALGVKRDIRVIPNFLDCHRYRRRPRPDIRSRYCRDDGEKLVVHMSNFRPVKRVEAVVEIFARIASQVPARLLLVGDGPDLVKARDLARSLDIEHRVEVLGEQDQVVPLLSVAACSSCRRCRRASGWPRSNNGVRVPVVASRVGGLSEVIEHGRTGSCTISRISRAWPSAACTCSPTPRFMPPSAPRAGESWPRSSVPI